MFRVLGFLYPNASLKVRRREGGTEGARGAVTLQAVQRCNPNPKP